MDLRHLRQFLAVADTLNLSRAADRAHVSQPALSRTIKLLEDELGVTLFERRARGVRLSEAGELLRPRAVALIRDSQATREVLRAASAEPTGEVALGMTPSMRVLVTAPVVAAFHQRYPKVVVSVYEGTSRSMRDAVAGGRTDVSLMYAAEPLGALRATPLLSENLFLIGPSKAGLKLDKAVTVRSLAERQMIQTSYPNSMRQIVDKAMAKLGIESRPAVQADMVPLMLDLVRLGVGFTVLPYCAIHEPLQQGLVSASPIKGLRMTWVLATSQERATTSAARRLMETLRGHARELVRDGTWRTAKWVGE